MSYMWDEKALSENKIGWKFPSTDGGVQEGFNDPAAENFTKGIGSLTREVIQNSLDAVNDVEKPVTIQFSCFKYPTKDVFPFSDEYIEHLNRCADSPSNKTSKILRDANIAIKSKSLYILKISDYNTTGLSNPLNPDPARSSFTSLLKGSGISGKNNEEGGSFGLGKTAPFLCSEARAVFYFSQNIGGDRAFQGKSILASHKWESNGVSYHTRNVGFFGNIDRDLTPLTESEFQHVPPIFTSRQEPGTDIFIMGFDRQDDEWDMDIEMSVLENFFIAIDEGKLICNIEIFDGDVLTIDKSSLHERMKMYDGLFEDEYHSQYSSIGDPEKNFIRYYYAYKDGKVFESEPGGLIEGSKLYILPLSALPEHLQYKNIHTGRTRQLFVRKLGMKVYEKQRDSLSPSIVVYIAHGTSLNNILQKCEPPAHNKWDYSRLPGTVKKDAEKKLAKDSLDAISHWIAECLRDSKPVTDDEFDVAGVSDYLSVGNDDDKKAPIQIEIKEKSKQKKSSLKLPSTKGKEDESGELGVNPRKLVQKTKSKKPLASQSQVSGSPATVDSNGVPGSIPDPAEPNEGKGGLPRVSTSTENKVSGTEEGKGAVPKKREKKKRKVLGPVPIEFNEFRSVASKENGQYVVMFTPEVTVLRGQISVNILGDTDSSAANVTDVSILNGEFGQYASINSGKVILRNIPANKKVRLQMTLDYKERASLSISLEELENE